MIRISSKLALGSANFGQDYGMANYSGKIASAELSNILSIAAEAGIDMIDTAQSYGDSEQRIGELANSRFKVITKIGIGLSETYSEGSVTKLVMKSCDRLGSKSIHAVMLHRPELFLSKYRYKIIEELNTLKSKKIIHNIGVSVYSPDILNKILNLLDLDLVQAPFNLFDDRILSSGLVDNLKIAGTQIHVRSIFLQGALLLPKEKLDKYFWQYWPEKFKEWYNFLEVNEVDPAEICLGHALSQNWVDKVVIGIDSPSQLSNLINISRKNDHMVIPNFSCSDLRLIDPSTWELTN